MQHSSRSFKRTAESRRLFSSFPPCHRDFNYNVPPQNARLQIPARSLWICFASLSVYGIFFVLSCCMEGRFMASHLWPSNLYGLLREFQSLPIPLRFSLLRCCMGGRSHQLANMIMDQSVHDDRYTNTAASVLARYHRDFRILSISDSFVFSQLLHGRPLPPARAFFGGQVYAAT